ncbi:DUF2332 domain-containing protein [Kribbella sp. NPDC004875]|uniref:DUF2332 domain-containing protein n=1 Tax=Kribbella sp. NPDC004875 TaxID=3364107 RepID=UPI0036CBB19D
MPRPTAGRAKPEGRARSLAQVYRRFAESDASKSSPLNRRIALALSESDEALAAIETASPRKRNPTLILAALHYLALTDQAPALAAAFAQTTNAPTDSTNSATTDEPGVGGGSLGGSGYRRSDAAATAAAEAVVQMRDSLVSLAESRTVRSNESGRYAVLYPAVAEVARRVDAEAIALIDVGRAGGLNLNVDRVGIAYSDGQSLGDSGSSVQVSASIVGDRRLPAGAIPQVVRRAVVDVDPVDVTDVDQTRWLRACLPPDDGDGLALLGAELELAGAAAPTLIRGEPVDMLPHALAQVPADVVPVVTTTWALSNVPLEGRLRFFQHLNDAATHRPVAWVAVEGVGVAPAIPTFGDRRASGHSIISLATFSHSSLHAESVGRTWSRGKLLSWLVP